ncbi:MAG: amidinotransferase [Flavobacteriales bacterium]|nr:amidinotransferase [Flavobacteriales bacterium]
MQTTSHILMIRPVAFGFNEQTATDNHYQVQAKDQEAHVIQAKALAEFDRFVEVLTEADVEVTVVDDTRQPHTPDSIFPNNWVSFHDDGTVILYPMCAPNRRQERRTDILDTVAQTGCTISQVIDMSGAEQDGRYLEGTGSLVLDRENLIAYSCLSQRTHPDLLAQWAAQTGYVTITFDAVQDVQGELLPIYHTNVMMSVGTELAIVCADSVKDPVQREELLATLQATGKHAIRISEDQKNHFAGNMLEVRSRSGKSLMVMSSQAFGSLEHEQVAAIRAFCDIVHSDLLTIETFGGGSARCMMAEVFLPRP